VLFRPFDSFRFEEVVQPAFELGSVDVAPRVPLSKNRQCVLRRVGNGLVVRTRQPAQRVGLRLEVREPENADEKGPSANSSPTASIVTPRSAATIEDARIA